MKNRKNPPLKGRDCLNPNLEEVSNPLQKMELKDPGLKAGVSPNLMKFSETHEWVEEKDGIATIGITHFAQKELGEIVYVELPEVGKSVKAGEEAAVLESTKAAADVYSPVSGKVIEINERLKEASEL